MDQKSREEGSQNQTPPESQEKRVEHTQRYINTPEKQFPNGSQEEVFVRDSLQEPPLEQGYFEPEYQTAPSQTMYQNNSKKSKHTHTGEYPKRDSYGRVVRYKKRGGILAFFMGMFSALFVLIFCGGLVVSYFYYAYKVDDFSKMLGVDLGFLPFETTNKTPNDIVKALKDYTDDYADMTVQDAESMFGLDFQVMLEQNLDISINGFYDIELSISDIDSGAVKAIKDFRIQDVLNNMKPFINALLTEIYKQVELGYLLDLADIDFSTWDYPIFEQALFTLSNPTFVVSGITYQLNFDSNKILDNEGKALTPTVNLISNSFTLNEIVYTVNTDRTQLTYNTSSNINLNYAQKKLSELNLYEILNTVLPSYVGGQNLTLGFLQTALGWNLIPDSIAEDPNFQDKYGAILNTVISELNPDELLDGITVRLVLELAGIDFIPFDDARYNPLLDSKIGTVTPDDMIQQLSVGALLDLIPSLDLSDYPFFTTSEFRAQTLQNVPDYVLDLTIKEIITTPEKVYNYSHFTFSEGGTEYYIIENNSDLDNGIYILDEETYIKQADITENLGNKTFILESVTYSIDETSKQIKQGTTNFANIASVSTVIEQLLYPVRDLSIRTLQEEDYDEIINQLKSITLGSLMGDKLTGFLSAFSETSLGELIENPSSLVSTLETLSLEDFAGLNPSDPLVGNLAILTIGQIMNDSNLVMNTIRNVTLESLGISSSDALLGGLATLTIGNIMDNPNSIMDTIKVKTLSEITGGGMGGIMGILGDLTIDDLMSDGNAINNALQNSYATLSELLNQAVSEYPYFVLNSKTYFIDNTQILELAKIQIVEVSDIRQFTIGSTTYQIDETNGEGELLDNNGDSLSILINKYKFTLDSVVYSIGKNELSHYVKVSDILDHKITLDSVAYTITPTEIKDSVGNSLNPVVLINSASSSITNAILTLKVKDLFGNDLSTLFKNAFQDVLLTDMLGSGNYLIDALINKGTADIPATFANLPVLIDQLNLSDLSIANSGIISFLSVVDDKGTPDTSDDETYTGNNIPLSMISQAFDSLDLTSLSINTLITGGILSGEPFEDSVFDSRDGHNTNHNPDYDDVLLSDLFAYLAQDTGFMVGFNEYLVSEGKVNS